MTVEMDFLGQHKRPGSGVTAAVDLLTLLQESLVGFAVAAV